MNSATVSELNALFVEIHKMQKPILLQARFNCSNEYAIAIVSKSVFIKEAKQIANKVNKWFLNNEVSINEYKFLYYQLIDNLAKPEHDRVAIENMRLF